VAVARLRRMAETAGRDPASLSITVFRAPPEAAALDRYRAAGIDQVLLDVPDLPRDEVLPLLDRLAPLTA
jgi:hypothetical protein